MSTREGTAVSVGNVTNNWAVIGANSYILEAIKWPIALMVVPVASRRSAIVRPVSASIKTKRESASRQATVLRAPGSLTSAKRDAEFTLPTTALVVPSQTIGEIGITIDKVRRSDLIWIPGVLPKPWLRQNILLIACPGLGNKRRRPRRSRPERNKSLTPRFERCEKYQLLIPQSRATGRQRASQGEHGITARRPGQHDKPNLPTPNPNDHVSCPMVRLRSLFKDRSVVMKKQFLVCGESPQLDRGGCRT